MKKLTLFTIAAASLVMLSCHHGRHTTIASHSDNNDVKLEYEGTITISTDKTRITDISHGGYLDYKHNSDELYASEAPDGSICYKLNGAQVAGLDQAGQKMLSEAIGMIVKSNH